MPPAHKDAYRFALICPSVRWYVRKPCVHNSSYTNTEIIDDRPYCVVVQEAKHFSSQVSFHSIMALDCFLHVVENLVCATPP